MSRHERYRKRCGGDGEAAYVDKDNPLPGLLDPITLEPVASPAISPWGHVMGMATWKVQPLSDPHLLWECCGRLRLACLLCNRVYSRAM